MNRNLSAHLVSVARSAPSPAAMDGLLRQALAMLCLQWSAEGGCLLVHEPGGFRVRLPVPSGARDGRVIPPQGLGTARRVMREGGVAALSPGDAMAALSGQRSRQGLLCSLENQLGPVELLFVWRTESWGREPREQLAVWARVFGVCRTSLAQSAAIDRLRLELQGAPQAPGTLTLRPLADVERETILLALQQTGGRIHGARGAAQLLGLHPNTLRSRMKKHGLGGARDHRPSRA